MCGYECVGMSVGEGMRCGQDGSGDSQNVMIIPCHLMIIPLLCDDHPPVM